MNKTQLIAIVIILGAGGLLGWRILTTEKGKSAGGHAGHAGHDEHGDERGAADRVKLTPAQLQQSGIVVAEVLKARPGAVITEEMGSPISRTRAPIGAASS